MKQVIIVYKSALPELKRQVNAVLKKHLHENFEEASSSLNSFLEKDDIERRRWYDMLLNGLLSASDFLCLFTQVKNDDSLKRLKKKGVSMEKITEVTKLITKLFDTFVVCYPQTVDIGRAVRRIELHTKTPRS